MDPISLTGAYQGLKAAKEILGALFDAKVDSESRPKILEAQGKLGEQPFQSKAIDDNTICIYIERMKFICVASKLRSQHQGAWS